MAFSLPRAGVIRSISVFFTVAAPIRALFNRNITITVQLYKAEGLGNIFSPIQGTRLELFPSFFDTVEIGDASDGFLENLNIPIEARSRLLLVFTAISRNGDLPTRITGYASAGISVA